MDFQTFFSLYFFDDFLCWSWVYACIMSNK